MVWYGGPSDQNDGFSDAGVHGGPRHARGVECDAHVAALVQRNDAAVAVDLPDKDFQSVLCRLLRVAARCVPSGPPRSWPSPPLIMASPQPEVETPPTLLSA